VAPVSTPPPASRCVRREPRDGRGSRRSALAIQSESFFSPRVFRIERRHVSAYSLEKICAAEPRLPPDVVHRTDHWLHGESLMDVVAGKSKRCTSARTHCDSGDDSSQLAP